MRPFLVFAPRGPVPESLEASLASVGAEVLVAVRPAEAASLLKSHSPGLILVVPPATMADASSLLPHLEREANPPPLFVLSSEAHPRPFALEVVGAEPWHRAATDLSNGSGGAGSAILVSRGGLVKLLDLWERLHLDRPEAEIHELVLKIVSQTLDAPRVSLFTWREGSPSATLLGSSLGGSVTGLAVEIERYPEIRASTGRSGPLLVEEVDRDPLMDGVATYLSAVPIRSVLCQKLPGSEDRILHAVREREPFGLSDVAFFRAAARLLAAIPLALESASAPPRASRDVDALAAAIRAVPDAAAVLSPTGEIRSANAPFLALTGRLESELLGLSFTGLLRSVEPGDEFAPPLPLSGAERYQVRRARVATAAGDAVAVEIVSPAEGETSAGPSVVVLRDRRAHDARETKLKTLLKERDDLSARLSTEIESSGARETERRRFWRASAHELKTPLHAMRGGLDLLVHDLAATLPGEAASLLATLEESLRRLEDAVEDVLDGASPAARTTPSEGDSTDLTSLVREVVETRRLAADAPPLTFVAAKELPLVTGRAERNARLVRHLVAHACRRASKTEGVRLETTARDGTVSLTVVDSGSALSEEVVSRLFAPPDATRGTGDFGLFVARRVADEVGASLSASSANGECAVVATWRSVRAG